MAEGNRTGVTGLLLMGLSDPPEVRFGAFDAVYSATFLANDTVVPSHRRPTISLSGCTLQLYFLVAPVGMDVFLLAVTASEHRLAILRPICYAVLTDGRVCVALAAGAWPARFLNSPLHESFNFPMTFCPSNRACPALAVGGISIFSITLGSYILVAAATLKNRSAEEKRRAWSTCNSRQLAVGLLYGPVIFTYIRPSSGHSPGSDGFVGMLYGVLNPVIYSLRNEEVKGPSGSY
ncbi:olfactory receptor 1020-like [Tachyglossus aculeatus]|uniref:olfactory receptor 1020-like n=1 Tax=Tachyglossus aculeatus TaxID=9261 RepID=UPI0018F68500|nr:olfactory receptor 1020-like [Tachyglossus aculeatus]